MERVKREAGGEAGRQVGREVGREAGREAFLGEGSWALNVVRPLYYESGTVASKAAKKRA